jgi:hypothetical protein
MSDTPKHMKEYFRQQGKKGGKKVWEGVSKEERSKRARKAAKARWAKQKKH